MRRRAVRARRPGRARPPRPRGPAEAEDRGQVVELAAEMAGHPETSPRLSGGDVDADWRRAHLAGDEAVGGSVATPDQDVVDELGEALGVPQAPDAEFHVSEEILRERDRVRWQIEREAAREEEEEEKEKEKEAEGSEGRRRQPGGA